MGKIDDHDRSRAGAATPAARRYDGLDAFRAISIFGVVFIHVIQVLELRPSPALTALIRARDCAMPIIILTSFFVLTRALAADPNRSVASFATRRFFRLELPFLLWSGLYWLTFDAMRPALAGGRWSWPPPTLWLAGWAHLWFLQFLFVGSLLVFPLVRAIVRHPRGRWIWIAGFVAAAGAYWLWGRTVGSSLAMSRWVDAEDRHVRVAVGQTIAYAKYIPLGIAFALASDTIEGLYRRRAFAVVAMTTAVAALVLHVTVAAPAVSRAIYSMAVFVALLGPRTWDVLGWLRPAARYAYPVYILHPMIVPGVIGVLALVDAAPSVPTLVGGSVAVFLSSWGTALALRTLVPADWFLPLVPVRAPDQGRGVREGRAITREKSWPLSRSTSRLRSRFRTARTF